MKEEDDDENEEEKDEVGREELGLSIKRASTNKMRKAENYYPCKEATPTMNRKRKKRNPRLTLDDKLTIIRSVIIDKQDYLFVSKQFRITVSYVSLLVQKARSKPEYLREMIDKKYEKIDNMFKIEDAIKQMAKDEHFIDSSKQVANDIT